MTEQRITILDASYSIFSANVPASKPKTPSNGSNSNANGNGNNNKNLNSGSSSSSNSNNSMDSSVMLQPILDFKKVVTEIVAGESGNGVFSIDVGLICSVDAVKRVGKALHDKLVVGHTRPSAVGENSAPS